MPRETIYRGVMANDVPNTYQVFYRCGNCAEFLLAAERICHLCGASYLDSEVISLDVLASYGYLPKGKVAADLKIQKPKRLEDLRKAQAYLNDLIKLVEHDG